MLPRTAPLFVVIPVEEDRMLVQRRLKEEMQRLRELEAEPLPTSMSDLMIHKAQELDALSAISQLEDVYHLMTEKLN